MGILLDGEEQREGLVGVYGIYNIGYYIANIYNILRLRCPDLVLHTDIVKISRGGLDLVDFDRYVKILRSYNSTREEEHLSYCRIEEAMQYTRNLIDRYSIYSHSRIRDVMNTSKNLFYPLMKRHALDVELCNLSRKYPEIPVDKSRHVREFKEVVRNYNSTLPDIIRLVFYRINIYNEEGTYYSKLSDINMGVNCTCNLKERAKIARENLLSFLKDTYYKNNYMEIPNGDEDPYIIRWGYSEISNINAKHLYLDNKYPIIKLKEAVINVYYKIGAILEERYGSGQKQEGVKERT